MMIRYISTLLASGILATLLPVVAHAYLNPYDVLLSDNLLLPSQPRTTIDRVDRQQAESSARREREQEAIFAEQHPDTFADIAPNVEMDLLHGSAEESANDIIISPEEREFNSLLRALERIKENQEQSKADAQVRAQAFVLLEEAGVTLGESGLHGGAPVRDLAPTGAGSILAMLFMFFAGIWTIRKVRQSEKVIQTAS